MNIPRREGCVGSPTLTRDKANSQYISGSNLHLTSRFCGVELGFKSTSKHSIRFKSPSAIFFSFVVDFLPWPILMVKIFAVVSLAIMDEVAFLGLVAAIPDIVTIVTEPIIHLILVGLSMVCLKALTYTLKSTLLL